MSQRASRKKRKQRRHSAVPPQPQAPETVLEEETPEPSMADRYARSRARDEAARAALKPLEPGERPRAVTVAVWFATACLIANLVTLIVGYDPDEPNKSIITVLGLVILAMCAWGMWRVRYWAVLGMQTILAFAVIGASIALINAGNVLAFVLCIAIIASAGTLFWFLVKALARIQMPEWPGAK